MIGLVVFIGVALVLFIILAISAPWRREQVSPIRSVGLPNRALMGNVLSKEDLAFVAGLHSPTIRRLFENERRRLALAWLSQMLGEAQRLRQLHAELARQNPDVSPVGEVRVLWQFLQFVSVYTVLDGLIRWYGPFRAHAALRSLNLLVNTLSELSQQMAGSAEAARRDVMPA